MAAKAAFFTPEIWGNTMKCTYKVSFASDEHVFLSVYKNDEFGDKAASLIDKLYGEGFEFRFQNEGETCTTILIKEYAYLALCEARKSPESGFGWNTASRDKLRGAIPGIDTIIAAELADGLGIETEEIYFYRPFICDIDLHECAAEDE
ncbi:hypothetical protein NK428_003078 [Vibrio navarrensis]|nr:hypothetical protein [Vibrio navarrensis]